MTDTYRSPNYTPEAVETAYVQCDYNTGIGFLFIEVNAKRQDIRQGKIGDERLIPQATRIEAIKRRGTWPSYVELDKTITLSQ
jgi:hypothetical protein